MKPDDSSSTSFNMWAPAWGSTWAYRLFQQHHRQINTLYWSHAGAKRHSYSSTKRYDKSDHASVLFSLPSSDNNNLDITLGKWASDYGEFDNWVRLNALVSITGYLEVFMKTVVRAAMESDPGVLQGCSRAVDGVVFLKSNPLYSQKRKADDVSIGDWNQRIAKIERIFGTTPSTLQQSVSKLESLRRTRNGVAHTFGRAGDDYDSIIDANAKPFNKVSEQKLVSTLALIGRIAKDIEATIGRPHIGDYETIFFYHQWDKSYNSEHQTEVKTFKKMVGQLHGRAMSQGHFEDLIHYYRSM